MNCTEFRFPEWMQEKLNGNSDVPKEKRREKILKFRGIIEYYVDFQNCGAACERLLQLAEASQQLVLGFDLEWPFGYKTGPGKTALIQICPNEHLCFLFHVSHMTSLPRGLIYLIRHPKVKLAGLNIKNDLRKLGRDFGFDVQSILNNNLIELSTFANSKLYYAEKWSLDRLVLNQLDVILEKPPDVRMSNWARETLSKEQLGYAATDAYASLLCYLKLKDLPTIPSNQLCEDFSRLGN